MDIKDILGVTEQEAKALALAYPATEPAIIKAYNDGSLTIDISGKYAWYWDGDKEERIVRIQDLTIMGQSPEELGLC